MRLGYAMKILAYFLLKTNPRKHCLVKCPCDIMLDVLICNCLFFFPLGIFLSTESCIELCMCALLTKVTILKFLLLNRIAKIGAAFLTALTALVCSAHQLPNSNTEVNVEGSFS